MSTKLRPRVSKKTGRPKGPEPTRPIQVRLRESVVEALEELARVNRRTRTLEIMIAIEDRLKAAGLWPDGEDSEEDAD